MILEYLASEIVVDVVHAYSVALNLLDDYDRRIKTARKKSDDQLFMNFLNPGF